MTTDQESLNRAIEDAYDRCQELGRAMMRISPTSEMQRWRAAYRETMEARKNYLRLVYQDYYQESMSRLQEQVDAATARVESLSSDLASATEAQQLSATQVKLVVLTLRVIRC
jgi:predicted translin family RNA/ssDNA-binding protein